MITLESSRDELHVVVVGVRPGRDDVEARFPDLADTELQVERRERERRQDLFWLPAGAASEHGDAIEDLAAAAAPVDDIGTPPSRSRVAT